MTGRDGSHTSPEPGSPGALAVELDRWEGSGGTWRVLTTDDDRIVLGLYSCDGEQMGRVSGAPTTVLRDFLAGRTSSEDG